MILPLRTRPNLLCARAVLPRSDLRAEKRERAAADSEEATGDSRAQPARGSAWLSASRIARGAAFLHFSGGQSRRHGVGGAVV